MLVLFFQMRTVNARNEWMQRSDRLTPGSPLDCLIILRLVEELKHAYEECLHANVELGVFLKGQSSCMGIGLS